MIKVLEYSNICVDKNQIEKSDFLNFAYNSL